MDPAASPRERVLYLLKTCGPQTADDLAGRLERTPMAVRLQLRRLADAGLVAFEDRRCGVGRPRRFWQLTAESEGAFRDGHGALVASMFDAARNLFGEEGVENLLRERSRQQAAAYRARMPNGRASLAARVQSLTRLRREEGYMAECEVVDGHAWLLVENHCPVGAAARCCSCLCDSELELFRDVLGTSVRVEREEHMQRGDRRCTYRIESVRNGRAPKPAAKRGIPRLATRRAGPARGARA
jgi:predicted ArsR family transcriptional regulator